MAGTNLDNTHWHRALAASDAKISEFRDRLNRAWQQHQDDRQHRDRYVGQHYHYGADDMDTDAEGVSTPAWWTTPEVRCLAERIVAAEAERRVYAAVVGDIREDRYDGSVDGSGCRVVEPGTGMWGDTDNTLLEVSKHEVASGNGLLPRDREHADGRFMEVLVKAYNGNDNIAKVDDDSLDIDQPSGGCDNLHKDCIYDQATGLRFPQHLVDPVRLVPYRLPAAFSVAIFGIENANPATEYDTAANGLLLHHAVARAMVDGALAVVPDVTAVGIEYCWRVVDPNAASLDAELDVTTCCESRRGADGCASVIGGRKMTIRDLHGERLVFTSSQSNPQRRTLLPAARYLYFYYLLCHLQLAWRQKYYCDTRAEFAADLQMPGPGLKSWQPFWPEQFGQHLAPTCLLALEEEFIRCATDDESWRASHLPGHHPDETEADTMQVDGLPAAGCSYSMVPLARNDGRTRKPGQPMTNRAGLVAMARIVQARRTLEEEQVDAVEGKSRKRGREEDDDDEMGGTCKHARYITM